MLPPLETLRVEPHGASIQVRVYAEDPAHDFRPSTGLLTAGAIARRTSAARPGSRTGPRSRRSTTRCSPRSSSAARHASEARRRSCETALAETTLRGLETNLDYLRQVVVEPEFRAGGFPTSFLEPRGTIARGASK